MLQFRTSHRPRRRFNCRFPVYLLSILLVGDAAANVSARGVYTLPQAGTSSSNKATGDKDIGRLEPGRPIKRELAGGDAHVYQLALAAGQYLHVVVDQRGIDVVVAVFGPAGKQIVEADSPIGKQGPEPVLLVAQEGGTYRLEVRPVDKGAAAGSYEARIEEQREARPEDVSRIAGERALAEAGRLHLEAAASAKRKAIEKYQEALPLLRAAGSHKREALALSRIGVLYDTLGEKQTALDYYNQGLTVSKAIGDREGEARTLNYIGLVYNSLGEKQKALDLYNQGLTISKAISDREGEARALNNLGLLYNSLGERQKALDHFNQALPVRKTMGDRAGEAVILNNLGLVYSSLGEKQKALDHLNQALPIMKATGNHSGEAATFANLGSVYNSLGEKRKALDCYNQALTIVKAIGYRAGEAITLNNLGLLYSSLGEKQKALDHLNQALPIMKALGNRAGEAATLNHLGSVYSSLGENEKALDYLNRALPMMQQLGDRGGEGFTLYWTGMVYSSLGENEKALDYLNRALLIQRAVGDRIAESAALFHIAKLERKLGRLSQARSHIEAALDIIESIRVEVAGPEFRSSFLASVEQYYESYIDLLMHLHKLHPAEGHDRAAFQAAERTRARTLLESLIEARADIRKGVDPSLVDRERSLWTLLSSKTERRIRLLSGRHTPEQAAEVTKEVEALISEYQELQSQIRARSPQYAALTQPQPLSLSEIQQRVLDADTLLLEYSLGNERSYLWAVSQNSLMSFEMPGRAEIEAAARRVYSLLTAPSQSYKSPSEKREAVARANAGYQEAAATLSRLLLGPVAEQLSRKRLLVVTEGALEYIPFAALPAPGSLESGVDSRESGKANNRRHQNQDSRLQTPDSRLPLIADHEIVSLPSASVLAVLRREIAGRKPAPKLVAVIADPVFDKSDPRLRSPMSGGKPRAGEISSAPGAVHASTVSAELARAADDMGLGDGQQMFPRLPFTRLEAKSILASSPPGRAWRALDFNANKAAAISPDLSQYRIVHFATHGLLNNQHPELSGLVFSLVDQKGEPLDGFLRLYDIYNLNLGADLVVLSACQTALGKEIKREGIVGLTRSFMYAGAARVMASLWKVDDEATAELMRLFYDGVLRKGLTPVAALRSAELAMWKQGVWRSPFYWAGFVIYGEWK